MTAIARRQTDSLWNAVRTRRPAADGAFVFAVRTTGVYCRPGCRSRTPRRENVCFFGSAGEAERAGFRPCKRCAPHMPQPPAPGREAVLRACRAIDAADQAPSLAELAAQAGLSPFHFQRLFKKTIGVSPKQYALARRSQRLTRSLRRSRSVTAAIYDAGYASSSRAHETAAGLLGMSPRVRRRGGAGIEIEFAVVTTREGPVLVAATTRGVCMIEFGASRAELRRRLVEEFPSATRREGGRRIARLGRIAARLINSPETDADLPLDIRGTAFQQRVWQALRRIPPGRTITYSALAKAIGAPRAARAVAGACAANRLAVAVPCHRVVGSDGDPRGYRWGPARKKALLERERNAGE